MTTHRRIIETIDLTKVYGMGDIRVAALKGVNVQIEAGEFVAIMGPSGSGKSTLLHILGCLSQPTSGQYILDGEDVSALNKVQLAAVRNHHVMYIETSAGDGLWLIRDYNSGGGLSRIHVRDVRGYVFVNPHARMASR